MNTKRKPMPEEGGAAADRHLARAEPRSGLRVFHVVFPSTSGNVEAKVLDYHFKGASLNFERAAFERFRELSEKGELHFYLGHRCLKFGVAYRVCWLDEISCQVGIEFKEEIKDWVQRDLRVPTHAKIKPSISCMDPTDPNRKLFFSAENVSSMGMMLSTSLTNKHLFPGMELRKSSLNIPGKDPIVVDLSIQNVHLSDDGKHLMVGALIRSKTKKEYTQAFQEYLSALGELNGVDQQEYKNSEFYTKKLKSSLTFRPVTSEEEYRKVLELRFMGYGHKGKVRQGQRLEDMGEGLANEGLILGAYLGKLLVASVELRFGSDKTKGFRFCNPEQLIKAGVEDVEKLMEINKLVVHPSYQGSDVLLGIFHRMHAIVISEGYLSGLLAATDKLVPLYLKVGGKKIGIRTPHPHLQGEFLNVILVDKSVYQGESEFNPFLWQVVYGTFHKFLEENNLATKAKKKPLRFMMGFARLFYENVTSKSKKKKKQAQALVSDAASVATSGSDSRGTSKLTEQHMNAMVVYPYIAEGEKVIGPEKMRQILDGIGLSKNYFEQKSNWVSIAFLDLFLDEYSKFADIGELSRKAGRVSMTKEYLGLNYYFLKNLGDPRRVLSVMGKFSPRLNKTRTVKVLSADRSGALIEVGLQKGYPLPKHKESCLNWQENFSYAVALLLRKPGQVEKLSCVYEGADASVYRVSWDLNGKTLMGLSSVLMFALTILSLVGIFAYSVSGAGYEKYFSVISLIGFAMLISKYYSMNTEKKEADQYFEKLQEESDLKYGDLQEAKTLIEHRYQEALLLDRISLMIQKSSDLGGILHTGLKQACELLDYSRAFVMILNTDTKKLETAAVHGAAGLNQGLSRFSVDVSVKRDNPALLSSVYHSGQSVMINNVQDHMFQLNDASKALISNLNVERFVMVAVPSEERNWGVIVAEKSSEKSALSKKDIVLLERVGQMMGVALDKHAAFESEARLRKSFQRYVPASVIEELTSSNATHLGGVEKKICALFLDIRAFTHISSTLGPQMSVDLLNRFFSFVGPIFAKHGGIIDKYLGDGILVTWGAIESGIDLEIRAVDAAMEVLEQLPVFNASSVEVSLPNIQIGIGVHAGPAIVGNVGSADRMEFTAIGHTVNYASRLESLNKVYGTSLCLSEQVVGTLKSTLQSRFSLISGVAVRGVASETNIAVLDLKDQVKIKGAA